MTGLIDCFGLPFDSLEAAAVLCDVCEINWPDQANAYPAKSARIEAGALMASLPSNCRIIQNECPVNEPYKGGCQAVRSIP